MKKAVMKKWVAGLRSGKYKQGRGALNRSGNLCCLGVLCEVLKAPKKTEDRYTTYNDADDGHYARRGILPESIMNKSGIKSCDGEVSLPSGTVSLTVLNDERSRSFKQIAAFIERNWKKL